MDYPRVITVVAEMCVIAIWSMVAWRNATGSNGIKASNMSVKLTHQARASAGIGIVLVTLAMLEGHLESWNDSLSVRVPLALLAMVCLAPSGLALLKVSNVQPPKESS